jgi:hypothetical protein
MKLKSLNSLCKPELTLVAVIVAALFIGSNAWGSPIPPPLPPVITSPAPVGVVEGHGPVTLTFSVFNPNLGAGDTLILDYAFASITPDVDDFALFSGMNGNAGLVSGSLLIGPGGTGLYTYSFTSPPDVAGALEDNDVGTNPVSFAIEMSLWPGPPCVGPPQNTISSATPVILWVDLTGCGETPNAAPLAQILAGMQPTGLLYTNGVNGAPPGVSAVLVSDTPELPSLFLMVAGLIGVVTARRVFPGLALHKG